MANYEIFRESSLERQLEQARLRISALQSTHDHTQTALVESGQKLG